jgi:hypothetical protein
MDLAWWLVIGAVFAMVAGLLPGIIANAQSKK